MKKEKKSKMGKLAFAVLMIIGFASCKDDNLTELAPEGIQRSTLTLTEIVGETVHAHGDHFHGLADGKEGDIIVVSFDEQGEATKNGHLHLEAGAIYKMELQAWDYQGKDVQQDFVTTKSVASSYKAFLVGGSFILNTDSETEDGAIFQPREQMYGDGTVVDGKYEATGIVSYFTVGADNEGATKAVSYVLRKLNPGVKAAIERTDWNRSDYETAFQGENVLALKFEIHAEHGHDH